MQTTLSAPYKSTSTKAWKVAVSTPIFKESGGEKRFLGVVAMSIELGNIINFQGNSDHAQFAVLIDNRPGEQQGSILQHPLLAMLRTDGKIPPDNVVEQRVDVTKEFDDANFRYRDPMGNEPEGEDFRGDWIVATAPVELPSADGMGVIDSGLLVLLQEDFEAAAAPSHLLAQRLAREGTWALAIVLVVIFALWFFVVRAGRESCAQPIAGRRSRASKSALAALPTMGMPTETKK
jgi:hypothetical protein